MVIGAHPLFMMAASARVAFGVDERRVAGGLMGSPLEVVSTPKYGIRVPASAEMVLEGTIDPEAKSTKARSANSPATPRIASTNTLLRVETILRRKRRHPGGRGGRQFGRASEPCARPARVGDGGEARERFPSVTAVHYPNSGTHFHAYVALQARGPARRGR